MDEYRQAVEDVGVGSFFFAAQHGHFLVVAELLENARDLEIAPQLVLSKNQSGITALQVAVENGHPKVVNRIMDCAADCGVLEQLLQSQDMNGHTALHEAVMKRDDKVVSELLRRPLLFRIRDSESALLFATSHCLGQIERMLREHLKKTADYA